MSRLQNIGLVVLFTSLIFVSIVLASGNIEPKGVAFGLEYSNNKTVIPAFEENKEVVIDLKVNLTGPVSTATFIKLSIDNAEKTKKFTDLLDYQNISYEIIAGKYAATFPTATTEFAFTGAGNQVIYLLVDTNKDQILNFEMNILGSGSPSPKLPFLDFGADGVIEWQFFGELLDYATDYKLPSTLAENEAGAIKIKDNSNSNKNYYCEEINLPYTRDLKIAAKLKELISGSNMKATVLQLETPGCKGSNCDAAGGQYGCNLSLSTSSEYTTCDVHLGYAIKDKFLVCVYNDINGNNNIDQVELTTEAGKPNSGYTCKASGSEYKCASVDNDDFFVKVKGGVYTEVLENTNANFAAGLVNSYQAFVGNLNKRISECVALDDGGCVVPLKVGSNSGGILSLQSLNMEYKTGALTKTKNTFYMQLDAEDGSITKIDGLTLINSSRIINLDTSGMYLYAPEVVKQKNFTLKVDFEPGPSNSTKILVKPIGTNATSTGLNITNAKGYINEYITFLNSEKTNYGDILGYLGYTSDIEKALSSLTNYYTQVNSIDQSNATKVNNFTKGLVKKLDDLMNGLPSGIEIKSDVSDTVVIEESDIADFMINADKKLDAYYLQNGFVVQGRARHVVITLFGETQKISKTVIEKQITGQGNNYYVYETIPASVIDNPKTDVKFADDFSYVEKGTFKKQYSSVNNIKYIYFVEGNTASDLSEMSTILIPTNGDVSQGNENLPICGDGKCAVLIIEGKKVYLEDSQSCPEDCSKKINWSVILLVFMIGILIVVAVWLYFKFYGNEKGKTKNENVSVFTNITDEAKLKDYITKSLASNKSKEEITNLLIKRGWKQNQVDYVFKNPQKIKSDKK